MYYNSRTSERITTTNEPLQEPHPALYMMRCAIWYHLYNLKNVQNTHGGVLILVKLQATASTFAKSNTPLWVFFTFLKLYKSY